MMHVCPRCAFSAPKGRRIIEHLKRHHKVVSWEVRPILTQQAKVAA